MPPDVGKLVALAVAAARIAEKDKVTFVCPELHLMEERGSVNGLWSAMDIQNCRIALIRVISNRFDYPAIDLHPVAVGKAQLFERRYTVAGKIFVVKVGKFLFFPIFLAAVDFLQTVIAHRNIIEGSVCIVKAVDAAVKLRGNDRFGLVKGKAHDKGVVAAGTGIIPAVPDCLLPFPPP